MPVSVYAFLGTAQASLQKDHAFGASVLSCGAARRGRMRMQVMGFLLVAAAFLACAAGYDALVQPGGVPAFQANPAQLHAMARLTAHLPVEQPLSACSLCDELMVMPALAIM